MKTILFLSSNRKVDNRDKFTYNFIAKEMKGLVERGYHVYHFHHNVVERNIDGIVYLGKNQTESISRLQTLMFIGRHLKTYLPLIFIDYKKSLWLAKLELAIGEIIEKYQVNVVHSHFMFPKGMCATNICRQKGVPVICTLRGAELYDEPTLSYGAMSNKFFRRSANISAKKVQLITAPNKEMQQIACNKFGLTAQKVIYLPNGVENNLLGHYSSSHTSSTNPLKLIAIGRSIYRKNHMMLLKAMAQLTTKDIELSLITEGELVDSYISFINQNKLDKVKLINEMPKTELYNMINDADCFVHPSYIEGLPNVVIEALAIGKPCIVSKIGAHTDIIEEGVNGYYIDHENVEDLVNLITDLYQHRNKITDLTTNCIESAKNFTLQDKLEKYDEIYQSITPNN